MTAVMKNMLIGALTVAFLVGVTVAGISRRKHNRIEKSKAIVAAAANKLNTFTSASGAFVSPAKTGYAIPSDAWGNPLDVKTSKAGPTPMLIVTSRGPDRVLDTADDIVTTRQRPIAKVPADSSQKNREGVTTEGSRDAVPGRMQGPKAGVGDTLKKDGKEGEDGKDQLKDQLFF